MEFRNTYQNYFEEALLDEIEKVGTIKQLKEGDLIMDIGRYIKSIPLLINGAIKVLREDEEGDELLLYFIEMGDTCAMTMSCCLGKKKSEIRAIAEVDTQLIMLPIQKMEEWMEKYATWRSFVLNSYQKRMTELLTTIDKIAFKQMDDRLLAYLMDKKKVNKGNFIENTHQEIAYELNTSRVVISRLLKKLENKGLIKLQRNRIEIIDL